MLTGSNAWKSLEDHFNAVATIHMRDLFKNDPNRFTNLSLTATNLTLDYSKNRLTEKTLPLLISLAKEADLENTREKMFSGEAINVTEQRAVLHTALRNFSGKPVLVDGKNIMPEVQQTLDKVANFVNKVSSGELTGYTNKAFTDVISIGIGGSFLGPKIMSEALKPYQQKQLKVHFIANVDACHLADVLTTLNPETTLIITSSKTMTTQETLRNANTAKEWFLSKAPTTAVPQHFACVSSNIEGAKDFGILEENIFPMWDWVGGRYSVWSAIGLPLALSIGFDHYKAFLEGAFEMDEHFQTAPLEENMPVILALLGVWYRNFHGAQSHVLLPYYHYLRGLPAYVQQLDMESNGKSVTMSNTEVDYATGPIIWGSEGTNGQHSFHQLIHQSDTVIPADFMLPLQPHHDVANHHDMLASNCFGQTQALMAGQSKEEILEQLAESSLTEEELATLSIHKVMKGNKPSNTLLFDTLCPKTLGNLIAMYEHKVFVQGVIWQVNSFDQWGVELGKALGNQVLSKISNTDEALTMDASTNGLIDLYRKARQSK